MVSPKSSRESQNGTVTISGNGLKTTKKNLTAGSHQIRVALTKQGISGRKHHKKMSVRVKFVAGQQVATASRTTRL